MLARLDRLVEFRDPLGPAAKHFLTKLRAAYLVETADVAERMAHENPHSYFLTPDGTCYHGRMVSGGRKSDAGPLALKRELRQHEAEALRLEAIGARAASGNDALAKTAIAEAKRKLPSAMAQHMEAEKSLVAATHQRDQARREFRRIEQQLGGRAR